jgi:hypothetical protein
MRVLVMAASELVLLQGLRDTRGTLDEWSERPWSVLRGWLAGSLVVAVGLLAAVLAVATLSRPDPTPFVVPGLQTAPDLAAVGHVLLRNSLVLALHSMACVAGFIAGSSLPLEAENHSGVWRWVHDRAGPLAIGFVSAATLFSLCTQAYGLGEQAASLSSQLGISAPVLLIGLLPHALLELVALFLPLAAWLIASRRGRWHELLAATFVTTGIAIPTLVVAAFVEVYLSPHLIAALAGG